MSGQGMVPHSHKLCSLGLQEHQGMVFSILIEQKMEISPKFLHEFEIWDLRFWDLKEFIISTVDMAYNKWSKYSAIIRLYRLFCLKLSDTQGAH